MNKFLILLIIPFLVGFTFNPMSQSIELGENQKSAQFLLENDTPEKQAIELTVKIREMDADGKETLTDTNEVAIFPPAVIIPPKEKRTIRVNYNGSKDLKDEKAFRVIAEQLSVKVDDKQKKRSGIQMLMRYVAALYVTPKDASSRLSVTEYAPSKDGLKLVVENSGNKHQILADPVITFAGKDNKKNLKGSDLNGLSGENVLAGKKRTFILKNVKDVPVKAETSIKINE